jgi:hypothetical protein
MPPRCPPPPDTHRRRMLALCAACVVLAVDFAVAVACPCVGYSQLLSQLPCNPSPTSLATRTSDGCTNGRPGRRGFAATSHAKGCAGDGRGDVGGRHVGEQRVGEQPRHSQLLPVVFGQRFHHGELYQLPAYAHTPFPRDSVRGARDHLRVQYRAELHAALPLAVHERYVTSPSSAQ